MTTETEKLLSLLYQAGAEIQVSNGWLLIGPPQVAQKFSEQIQRLKPEIMLALGYCHRCGAELVKREGELQGKAGRLIHCPKRVGHYERWQFN